MNKHDVLGLAAIVSRSVGERRSPILFACRDVSVRPEDSGWQFWGHPDVEDESKPQVWRLDEVLALEPTLAPYLNALPGIFIQRSSARAPWHISELPPEK